MKTPNLYLYTLLILYSLCICAFGQNNNDAVYFSLPNGNDEAIPDISANHLFSGTGHQTIYKSGPAIHLTDETPALKLKRSFADSRNLRSLVKYKMHLGPLFGFLGRPVFREPYENEMIAIDQVASSFGMNVGVFFPIRRFGLDLGTSMAHSRFKNFTHNSASSGEELTYENPAMTFVLFDAGLHFQLFRSLPLTIAALTHTGAKIYSNPLPLTTNLPGLSEDPKSKGTEFTAGFGLGIKCFISDRFSIQLENQWLGTFESTTSFTTTNQSTTVSENDNSLYSRLIAINIIFHLL